MWKRIFTLIEFTAIICAIIININKIICIIKRLHNREFIGSDLDEKQ